MSAKLSRDVSQPTPTSTSSGTRKRTRNYSESMWPKSMKEEECNILFSNNIEESGGIERVVVWLCRTL